ncbi:MAG: SDR family oxidoreductase [Clostridiaceae bacterium]|jgi:short-subunit dehydrogenase|nr:SDR family oxidoreductase [Clostridiaceae bacterium]
MKIAIVTGSSKGIGKSIVKRLLSLGYKVYGISRTVAFEDENFIPVVCDILDTNSLLEAVDEIRKKESRLDLLVNNAGIGVFGPHEQLNAKDLQKMVRLNLEAPILLTNRLLREIIHSKGTVIFISSVTAKKTSTYGCAYAATKAGLSKFAESLFEEVRKKGVKITVIHPDMTMTNFYDKSDFTCDDNDDTYISSEQVADCVEFVLNMDSNLVVNDITLRPQINRIKRKKV